jgi:dolichol kinase
MVHHLFLFSPLLIVTAAFITARRVSKGKWLIHLCAVILMLSALPIFAWATSGEDAGPGDGFLVSFYLLLLLATLVFYAAYAVAAWHASSQTTNRRAAQ